MRELTLIGASKLTLVGATELSRVGAKGASRVGAIAPDARSQVASDGHETEQAREVLLSPGTALSERILPGEDTLIVAV